MFPTTGTKVVVALVIALLLLTGIGALSFRSTLRMVEDGGRVIETHRIVSEIERLVGIIALDAAKRRGSRTPRD